MEASFGPAEEQTASDFVYPWRYFPFLGGRWQSGSTRVLRARIARPDLFAGPGCPAGIATRARRLQHSTPLAQFDIGALRVTDATRLLHNLRSPSNTLATAMKLIVRWLLLAAALLLVAHLSPGVTVNSFGAALVAALVLGLLNTLVRPLLVLLTLPVTVLTLGLFLFVINALMFWAAAGLLAGFKVDSFGSALIGSVIYSISSTIIDVAIEHLFEE